MFAKSARTRAFSLIELVIVVVIIGIIGAIAIPRMSRGAQGAGDSALVGNLAVLRSAIDLFATEHGGKYPKLLKFKERLETYSNAAGDDNATSTAEFIYGPYLRAIPPLPVGPAVNKGMSGVIGVATDGYGWIYNETTGKVTPNTGTDADSSGKLYSDY